MTLLYSFIFQLKRTAKRYDWSSRKKADRLVDCLGGKALEYVRELHLQRDFKQMVKKLTRRFGVKDAPDTVRRELPLLKQEETETLEEFSQRVHFKVMDGFPGAKERTIEQLAVEHFLKGCTDRKAASIAMDKTLQRFIGRSNTPKTPSITEMLFMERCPSPNLLGR